MKAPYNLVIIDMQEGYSAAKDPETIDKIKREIEEAKENKAAVIVVEMDDYVGKTLPIIMNDLKKYRRTVLVKKMDTSGADRIRAALRSCSFLNRRVFKVCGVYTDVCVADTVNDLSRNKRYKIDILADGCHCDVPAYEDDIEMFEDDGITYDPYRAIEGKPNVQVIWE